MSKQIQQRDLLSFRKYNLSKELYILQNLDNSWHGELPNYRNGTIVRLISGVDDNATAGYHFAAGFVTVCRVDTYVPEFIGFRKEQVVLYKGA